MMLPHLPWQGRRNEHLLSIWKCFYPYNSNNSAFLVMNVFLIYEKYFIFTYHFETQNFKRHTFKSQYWIKLIVFYYYYFTTDLLLNHIQKKDFCMWFSGRGIDLFLWRGAENDLLPFFSQPSTDTSFITVPSPRAECLEHFRCWISIPMKERKVS